MMSVLSSASFAEVVNINKADASALALLKGIGEKKARAIVAYRKKNGKFKTINELANVKGIGDKTVAKNKRNMSTSKGITSAPRISKKAKKKTTSKTTKASRKTTSSKKSAK